MAASRYFSVLHGVEIPTVHRQTVEPVRAVARRSGDLRWRLIGIEIRELPHKAAAAPPSIDTWAEKECLDDWSHAGLPERYWERFDEGEAGVDSDPALRRR